MKDWAPLIIALLSAGGGAILLELTKRILDAASGRGRRRRDEVDRAWQRVDREASTRRRWQEHGSLLRRMLIAAPCVDTNTIPDPPTDKES